jgi:RimJ/RimL family protein N-acetyltransferase
MITIREITTDDSEKYLELSRALDSETIFRPYDPGERNCEVSEQYQKIVDVLNSDNSTIIVAEVDKALVGYISASGKTLSRLKHISTIGIAIKQEFCGQGIGKKLFESLEEWACSNKIHRLELTVMTNNLAALGLYLRMGFKLEGTKMHSLLINNEYYDDYYMSKLI